MKNFIRFIRKKKKLTLVQLACRSKVPVAVLSMIEKDLVAPSGQLKFRIAKGLNTKAEKLFPEEILPEKLKSRQGLRKAKHTRQGV